jgi:uncharacterized protein YjbI with pentapeptide repeats
VVALDCTGAFSGSMGMLIMVGSRGAGCDVEGCDVEGCDVEGCDVEGCDVEGCDVEGCVLDIATGASGDDENLTGAAAAEGVVDSALVYSGNSSPLKLTT